MKETIKLGIILLVITAVSAGVLAFANNITGPIIAERQKAESFGALAEIFTEADDFSPIDEAKLEEIQATNVFVKEVFEAKSNGESIGYALKTGSSGYSGEISTIIGINMDGALAGIKVVGNSETPNIGTRIEGADFQDSFIGKSSAGELVPVGSPSADNEVLLLSGATVSVYGVLAGVNDATEAFNIYLSGNEVAPIVVETEEEIKSRFLSEIFVDAGEILPIDESKVEEIKAENIFIREIYEAKVNGELVGYGIMTVSGGYGGDLPIITGINIDGTIAGIRIFKNEETPGIGTKIMESEFLDAFIGKTALNELTLVESASAEDEVQVISGATVSVEGVLYGINGAIDAFNSFLK